MNFKSDFKSDWYEMLQQELIAAGYDLKKEGVTFANTAHAYYNAKQRIPETCKRKVEVSDAFSCPEELEQDWQSLKAKIENGDDLKPYLSKLVTKAAKQDHMLSDWGIYHFHLGTIMGNGGFINRTGPLLFARLTSDTFYAVDVYNHGAWVDTTVLEIIHRNWPSSIAVYRNDGLSYSNPNDEQRASFREQHINAFYTANDGTVYVPVGGGVMTSGNSAMNTVAVIKMHNLLKNLTELLEAEKNSILQILRQHGYTNETEVLAKLDIDSKGYYVTFPEFPGAKKL